MPHTIVRIRSAYRIAPACGVASVAACGGAPARGPLLAFFSLLAVSAAFAIDTTPAEPDLAQSRDPLAGKQQIVRDRMTQLEDRMFRLSEKLAGTEPQQAKRLEAALRQARELLIRRNMEEAITLLEQGRLTDAGDRQAALTRDLDRVLKILLEDPDSTKERQQELDRIKEYREQIKALLDAQRKLQARTDTAPSPPEPDLARRQRDLEARTDQLAGQMQSPTGSQPAADAPGDQPKAAPPSGTRPSAPQPLQPSGDGKAQDSGGKPADGQPPKPGVQNLQQAGGHMKDAAEDLEKNQPRDASQDQAKAIEQLEQARRQLEEILEQLRREQQEEVLRGLEARFQAMLAQQIIINQGTEDLHARGPQTWVHADELMLAGLARDQTGLADAAAQALSILKEEGTTIVFPRIVEELRQDMLEVARRLGERQTGPPTPRMQADLVTTLSELIEAIKELRKELQDRPSGGGGPGGPGSSPLLPDSAELKLLRSCQQRVNRQTADFEKARADAVPAPAPPVSADSQREIKRLADRQREVAEMARKMNERLTGQ